MGEINSFLRRDVSKNGKSLLTRAESRVISKADSIHSVNFSDWTENLFDVKKCRYGY